MHLTWCKGDIHYLNLPLNAMRVVNGPIYINVNRVVEEEAVEEDEADVQQQHLEQQQHDIDENIGGNNDDDGGYDQHESLLSTTPSQSI